MLPRLWFPIATALSATASIIYDGRVPLSMDDSVLDVSSQPFNTAVRGLQPATYYSSFSPNSPPTALYNPTHRAPKEQSISIAVDYTSIFTPGGSAPQYGFRRTELIAPSSLNSAMDTGKTRFHFSVKADEAHPLDYTHEYQIVFIEPSDGSHVFGVQLGSPFTIPSASVLPAANATHLKVLDHSLNVVFSTPFTVGVWSNFAVDVDWDELTLQVSYSTDGNKLAQVTEAVVNEGLTSAVTGDFHFGVLKLPLANPADTPADQADVVHHGIQLGGREGLLYSGVFVESV